MPLRDHFHPPLSHLKNWEGFHGLWPGLIAVELNRHLPARYSAEPRVHLGPEIEIDVASFEDDVPSTASDDSEAGLAFSPEAPSVAVETELFSTSDYEVRVFDERRNRRLVSAIEIVSPANKDRPESRRVFVEKCAALLRRGVSVTIVDLVTTRQINLYSQLLELIGESDPSFGLEIPSIYAASCRWIERGGKHILETWSHRLHLRQPLPTLPLWLTETQAIPLNLEISYEDTCRGLRIPKIGE